MSDKEQPARLRVVGSGLQALDTQGRKSAANQLPPSALRKAEEKGPKRTYLLPTLLFLIGSVAGGGAVAWFG